MSKLVRNIGALAVIAAAGVTADLYAQIIINNNGRSCYICTNAQAGATCNGNNADYVAHCQNNETAHCSYNSLTGQLSHTCGKTSIIAFEVADSDMALH